MYDGEKPVVGPAPLSELGLLWSPIRAALVWGSEKNKIYFFRNGYYWRFHASTRRVNSQVPRRATDWRGVPSEVDAAFQDADGALVMGWLGGVGGGGSCISHPVGPEHQFLVTGPLSSTLPTFSCQGSATPLGLQIRLRVREVQGRAQAPWP